MRLSGSIKNYISVRYDISEAAMQESFQRKEIWDYPLPAIREALLNAPHPPRRLFNNMVRTQVKIFDDHIRLHNPGHLPEGITIEMNLKEHYSYLRNPKIAEIFYRAGLVERYGSGIERAISVFNAGSLPTPAIASLPLGFAFTMRKDPFTEEYLQELGLNKRQVAAISFLRVHGAITNSQHQDLNAVAARTTVNDLNGLVRRHIVEQRGRSRRDAHYILAPAQGGGDGGRGDDTRQMRDADRLRIRLIAGEKVTMAKPIEPGLVLEGEMPAVPALLDHFTLFCWSWCVGDSHLTREDTKGR